MQADSQNCSGAFISNNFRVFGEERLSNLHVLWRNKVRSHYNLVTNIYVFVIIRDSCILLHIDIISRTLKLSEKKKHIYTTATECFRWGEAAEHRTVYTEATTGLCIAQSCASLLHVTWKLHFTNKTSGNRKDSRNISAAWSNYLAVSHTSAWKGKLCFFVLFLLFVFGFIFLNL